MDDETQLEALTEIIMRGRHPAREAAQRWNQLLTSWQVFETNTAQLIEAIRAFERDPKVHMRVLYEPPVGSEEYRERFTDELIRRWHNYVSSASTYLDHEQVLIRAEPQTFETHVRTHYGSTLAKAPAVHFTRRLRNYILHRGWPPSQFTMKFTPTSASYHVLLKPPRLLASGFNWTGLSRVYLEAKPDELALLETVEDFATTLAEFHDWLTDEYWAHHSSSVDDYEELLERYRTLGGWTPPDEQETGFYLWDDDDFDKVPEDAKLLLSPWHAALFMGSTLMAVLRWAREGIRTRVGARPAHRESGAPRPRFDDSHILD